MEAGSTYLYKLESVDTGGESVFHGPVEMTLGEESVFGCGMATGGRSGLGLFALVVVGFIASLRRRLSRK